MSYPYQIKTKEKYHQDYTRSVQEPEAFWGQIADQFVWKKKWDRVLDWNFTEPRVAWFSGAQLNITENCIDRHLADKADQPAIIWEPNNPDESSKKVTYKELHQEVCKFSNILNNIKLKY